MYLFIDTSWPEEVRLAVLADKRIVARKIARVGHKYSEKILTEVDGLLKKGRVKLGRLKAVLVVSGPGRFSALRTGVSVANALAWGLEIPVVPFQITDRDNYWAKVWLSVNPALSQPLAKFRNFVVPVYGQEPNITN